MGFWILVLLLWVLILTLRVRSLQRNLNRLDGLLSGQADQPDSRPERQGELDIPPEKASAADAWQAEPPLDGSATKRFLSRAPSLGWEQQFGVRLSVWLGGIALAFAGIYLVRYSLETDLFSPAVRVWSGVLAGLALLLAAGWLRRKPALPNGERITQALSGAGIVVLYASVFAAASLYDMVPPVAGFAGMALVTLIAVFLSLKYGPPIALLGLLGGFATPMLISSDSPAASALFIYLLLVFGGLMVVMQRQGWWLLALVAILVGFVWVPLWVFWYWAAGDGPWVGLFLLGAAAVLAWATGNAVETRSASGVVAQFSSARVVSYTGFAAALLLMAMVVVRADYGTVEWLMLATLAAGTMLLAWGKPAIYKMAPFVSLGISLLLMLFWHSGADVAFAPVVAGFTLLFTGGSLALLRLTRQTLQWMLVLCTAVYGFFLVSWFHQRYLFAAPLPDVLWGMMALLLAILLLGILFKLQDRITGDKALAQRVQATGILTATALVTSGAAITLDVAWWLPVLAAEMLLVAWINTRASIVFLRTLMKMLLGLMGLAALPLAIVSTRFAISSMQLADHTVMTGALAIVQDPLLQFVLSGALLLGAAYLLRRIEQEQSRLVRLLDYAGIGLIALGSFYLLRQIFYGEEAVLSQLAGFGERGTITLMLLTLAALALWLGRRQNWESWHSAGLCLALLALGRVVYFDLMVLNPWWSQQPVAGLPVLNLLWLNYMAPVLAIWIYWRLLQSSEFGQRALSQLPITALLLVMAFVTLQVRHFFHGEVLSAGATGNAEVYTYSAVWLVAGMLILAGGVIRHAPQLRYASLAIILLAVAKVFLYDAAALGGLYRVASFLGLGVCLIALSYFYSRFVFARHSGKA